ncbi:hypothetical protein K461DRAFT_90010 [Myriangium duriaei CBS 260.36]|uniref:Uncharacterized protein n=1 Tax=Myriangium duriaei CBS 260.36 TaxID=1168546 RepID=A0A9P4J661_9PEZI|nr:hypothetical protein K461DRAFT_90010 [Myriangium duriaei CBS 260.36]
MVRRPAAFNRRDSSALVALYSPISAPGRPLGPPRVRAVPWRGSLVLLCSPHCELPPKKIARASRKRANASTGTHWLWHSGTGTGTTTSIHPPTLSGGRDSKQLARSLPSTSVAVLRTTNFTVRLVDPPCVSCRQRCCHSARLAEYAGLRHQIQLFHSHLSPTDRS